MSIEESPREYPGGVFTGRFLKAEADDVRLKTYVMATLVHALSSPLPAGIRADREEMTVVTHFKFSVFGVGEIPRNPEPGQLKNLLYFVRQAYVDPKLNDTIEKLMTHYLPPIIPVPGGFYLTKTNFSTDGAKEHWKSVIRKSEMN